MLAATFHFYLLAVVTTFKPVGLQNRTASTSDCSSARVVSVDIRLLFLCNGLPRSSDCVLSIIVFCPDLCC